MTLFEYYIPNFSTNPGLLAFLISLTVIAIFCNANVFIGIIIKKRLHTFANILAASLAIGDLLLVISICLLQSQSQWNTIRQNANLKGTWLDRCSYTSNRTKMASDISTVQCYDDLTVMLQDLVSSVVTATQLAVILHLLVMTIDRYFAIVHPLSHYLWENYGISNKKKAIVISILIWIISFIFSAAYFSIFSGVTQPSSSADTYVTTGYYTFIIACLIITFFLNIPIIMTATVPNNLDKEKNDEGFASLLPQNMKMAVTFFLILTCISVGYAPDCIVYTLRNNNIISNETFSLHYTYIVLVKLFTCILNPIIYGLRTFKITFSALCHKTDQKAISNSTITTTISEKSTKKRGSEVGERRAKFQHSSSLLFKQRRESDQQKKKAIPKLIVIGIILMLLFGCLTFLFIDLDKQLDETHWPSDGALVVLGGCLQQEGPGCNLETANVEILADPSSMPGNCTIPPFPKPSFNHASVFFNNTIISCGGSSLGTECLSWRPGDTDWNVEYHLTHSMMEATGVVTSYGAWFLGYFEEGLSNVLTHTNNDGKLEKGPPATSSPRSSPCVTAHSGSDSIIVISGFMYDKNNTVEMYTANMTFWRYLPVLDPPRTSHSCGSIGDFIVTAGGFNLLGYSTMDTVEVLNLASDEGWIKFPPLSHKMLDGILNNLLGSLIIVGGTQEIIQSKNTTLEITTRIEAHNTSLTNNFLNTDYPFESSSVVGILAARELGHSVIPIRINDLCHKET